MRKFLEKLSALQLLAIGLGLLALHLNFYASSWTAWLCLFCYAPLIAWYVKFSKKSFRCGLVFGLFHSWFNMYWLGQFVGRWTSSVVIGALVIVIVGMIWGTTYGAVFKLCSLIIKRFPSTQYPLIFVSLLLAETMRQALPQLAFPFTPIGESLVTYPIWTAIVPGSLLTTTVVIGINTILAPLLISSSAENKSGDSLKPIIGIGASLLVVVLFADIKQAIAKPHPTKNVRIALGQLGFDMAYGDPTLAAIQIKQTVERLIQKAKQQNADILILPEAVAAFASSPETSFRLPKDMNILFGAARGNSPKFQSAYLWDGKSFQHTDKNRLVVFGEYVPFRGLIPYPQDFKLPAGDLAPGQQRYTLKFNKDMTVGPMICFESLFDETSNDFKEQNAGFLCVMSLDDWYMGTSAIPRLFTAARWRAVESQRWVGRVGSLGKTAVINPQGQIVKDLAVGQEDTLLFELPLMSSK